MDKHEFEQFVTEHGKDILRFCRMNAGSTERGNELYQDTMVKLLEKQKKLDAAQLCHADSNPAVESPEDPSQKQAFLKLQIK